MPRTQASAAVKMYSAPSAGLAAGVNGVVVLAADVGGGVVGLGALPRMQAAAAAGTWTL